MISLSIISAADTDYIDDYTFYFNTVDIGKSKSCHLYVNDKSLQPLSVQLKIRSNGILVKCIDQDFFLSNGKKVIGEMIQNIGDTITIGDVKIKLLKFEDQKTTLENYEDLFKKAFDESPQLESLLEVLEEEIRSEIL